MSTQPKKLAEQVTLPKTDKKAAYENPVADFWKLKLEMLKQSPRTIPTQEAKHLSIEGSP
jgi:hypothetical protein